MVDVAYFSHDLRTVIVAGRRAIEAIVVARRCSGFCAGRGETKRHHGGGESEFQQDVSDHGRPQEALQEEALREWLRNSLAAEAFDVRICGLTG